MHNFVHNNGAFKTYPPQPIQERMSQIMSYILYSSIARAGGIDLLLNTESFVHEPTHRLRRRRSSNRLARLRRGSGRALIALGAALTAWGRSWAPPPAGSRSPALETVR